MKKYKCIKDFYINGNHFASRGDTVTLLQDGATVVNTNGKQRAAAATSTIIYSDYFMEIKDTTEDRVNHPSHYTWLKEKCGIEVIDITRWLDFDTGNAVKYLLRAGYKEEEGYSAKQKEIEDLKKAIWYIEDKLKQLGDG